MAESRLVRRHGLLHLTGWPFGEEFSFPTHWRDVFAPELRVEEFVDGDQFVLRAEAPGVDPDTDVEVTVVDGTLRFCVQRREETRDATDGRYRSEFSYGALYRAVPLPEGADAADVKATYADGILEIRMPVRQPEHTVTQIPVTRV